MSAEPTFGAATAGAYDETRALPPQVLLAAGERIAAAGAIGPDERVLDVGAGTGLLSGPLLLAGCAYVGVDTSRPMLRQFPKIGPGNVALLQADARALPFATGSFDLVLAFRVFGVVPGWRRGVQECLRVLRPGGRLIVGRVERSSDSLHAIVRDLRNAWLTAHGFASERPGADDAALLEAVGAHAAAEADGEPIAWTEQVTPRRQIEANLYGWRVRSLDAALRSELRAAVTQALSERLVDLDAPVNEPAAVALHSFCRRR